MDVLGGGRCINANNLIKTAKRNRLLSETEHKYVYRAFEIKKNLFQYPEPSKLGSQTSSKNMDKRQAALNANKVETDSADEN